ncbi:MAG: FAD:protein FMN transferase [Owenweeksia sp.]|nr:FAD:protein FMN transferase [Owenweeksia sp.]
MIAIIKKWHRLPTLMALLMAIPLNAQKIGDNKVGQATKPHLLIFSGSDWCLPCIRLEKEVFSTPAFKDFAGENLHVLKIDFPQKQQLERKAIKRNDSLAALYNPEGAFPFLLLLSPTKKPLDTLPTTLATPEDYINRFQKKGFTQPRIFRKKALLMGSGFEFAIVHWDAHKAEELLQYCVTEVNRLEQLISDWTDSSEVSAVNRQAGLQPVRVGPELYSLTERSLRISKITQGAYDISFQGLDTWQFDQKDHPSLPPADTLKKRLKRWVSRRFN